MSKTPSEIMLPLYEEYRRVSPLHDVDQEEAGERHHAAMRAILDSHASQLAAQGEQLARVVAFLTAEALLIEAGLPLTGRTIRDAARTFLSPPAEQPTPPSKPQAESEWGPEVVAVWKKGDARWRVCDGISSRFSESTNEKGEWKGRINTDLSSAYDQTNGMTRIYTRPTPTAKGPSPSQPDAGSLEQQAREWAEKIIAPNKLYDGAISFWDTTSPNGIPMNCGNFTDTRTPGHLRSAMVRILTAFATQHAASLEARVKFTESIAAINKSTADAMEARALAAERKADDLTAKCAAQAATIAAERKAYSELRFQHTKLESRFSTVKQHLQLWNDATTNIAANQAMSNAFEEATK